jgi:hypothetical protein
MAANDSASWQPGLYLPFPPRLFRLLFADGISFMNPKVMLLGPIAVKRSGRETAFEHKKFLHSSAISTKVPSNRLRGRLETVEAEK